MTAYIANFTYLQKKFRVGLMIHRSYKNLIKTYTTKNYIQCGRTGTFTHF